MPLHTALPRKVETKNPKAVVQYVIGLKKGLDTSNWKTRGGEAHGKRAVSVALHLLSRNGARAETLLRCRASSHCTYRVAKVQWPTQQKLSPWQQHRNRHYGNSTETVVTVTAEQLQALLTTHPCRSSHADCQRSSPS
eukprot:scpid79140/ scgid21891/ 